MTPDPMHQKLIRRAQRQTARAARQTRIGDARRLARVEVEVDALHAQVITNSLILGTTRGTPKFPAPRVAPEPTYGPPARHPEAESLPLGAEDDVMLAGWSLDLWPNDEFEQIIAETKPVLAGPVYYCPICGAGSSGGGCPRGCPS